MKKEAIGVSPDGREIYKLWAWNEEFKLKEVESYKTKTSNEDEDVFYVPSLGFSGSLGHALFETKEEAYFTAKANIARMEKALFLKSKNLEESYSPTNVNNKIKP